MELVVNEISVTWDERNVTASSLSKFTFNLCNQVLTRSCYEIFTLLLFPLHLPAALGSLTFCATPFAACTMGLTAEEKQEATKINIRYPNYSTIQMGRNTLSCKLFAIIFMVPGKYEMWC